MAASQRTLGLSFAKGIFLQLVDTELLAQSLWFWGFFGWVDFLQCCFYNSTVMVKFF